MSSCCQRLVAQMLERRPLRSCGSTSWHRARSSASIVSNSSPFSAMPSCASIIRSNFRSWPIFAERRVFQQRLQRRERVPCGIQAEGSSSAVWPIGRYLARRAPVENAMPTSDARIPPGQSPITLSAKSPGAARVDDVRFCRASSVDDRPRSRLSTVSAVGANSVTSERKPSVENSSKHFCRSRPLIVETEHVDVRQRHVGADSEQDAALARRVRIAPSALRVLFSA